MALLTVEYASKLGANYVDTRLEIHYEELITAAGDKVQRIRTLVNGT